MSRMNKLLRVVALLMAIVQVIALPVHAQKIPETALLTAMEAEWATMAETTAAEEVPEQIPPYNPIPKYYQTDYPDTMYGGGTIGSSGCGITSLSMVATYLTGIGYMPDELARYFGGDGNNNIERLEYGSTALRLPWRKATDWHDTLRELQAGKVAIALMEQDSVFTDSQHFIVLCGMTEDGKILVNDPYEPNYQRWDLERALIWGFEPGDICCGFSGAWVYDPSAMPEEPYLYYEENPDRSGCRYGDLELTDEEWMLISSLVWLEAQGECLEGQQAVAEVVLNRLAAGTFNPSIESIIFAEGQFRSASRMETAEPTQTQYEAVERALYGPYVVPKEVVYFATYPATNNVWGQIGGHIFCYDWK